MKTIHRNLLTVIAAASLAACSSVKLDDAPIESRTGSAVVAGNIGAAGGGAAGSQTRVASVDVSNTSATTLSGLPRVVYFDYDSYVVKDEFRPVIEANAKALASNQTRHMAVEGHTDDRGGREYNLALGQKRAEAVVKALTLLGASESQIEPVSFGKERAAVQGSDEAAWAKNRRAELTYRR